MAGCGEPFDNCCNLWANDREPGVGSEESLDLFCGRYPAAYDETRTVPKFQKNWQITQFLILRRKL
jgi:hypothetical protein